MTTSTYPQQLHTISLIAAVIRSQHLNHERRNERLNILRALIAAFVVQPGHFDRGPAAPKIPASQHLQALYELVVEGQDHEDHSAVKSRLRLVEETCDYLAAQYKKADEEEREERTRHARYERMQYQAHSAEEARMDEGEAIEGESLTSDPSPWDSALDAIEGSTDNTPRDGDIEF